jgi:hypothetical protein
LYFLSGKLHRTRKEENDISLRNVNEKNLSLGNLSSYRCFALCTENKEHDMMVTVQCPKVLDLLVVMLGRDKMDGNDKRWMGRLIIMGLS